MEPAAAEACKPLSLPLSCPRELWELTVDQKAIMICCRGASLQRDLWNPTKHRKCLSPLDWAGGKAAGIFRTWAPPESFSVRNVIYKGNPYHTVYTEFKGNADLVIWFLCDFQVKTKLECEYQSVWTFLVWSLGSPLAAAVWRGLCIVIAAPTIEEGLCMALRMTAGAQSWAVECSSFLFGLQCTWENNSLSIPLTFWSSVDGSTSNKHFKH